MKEKKLTKEQKRLIVKKRIFDKNELVTIMRKSYRQQFLTMRKDFYGMLKKHIEIEQNAISDKDNKSRALELQSILKKILQQHENVFRREISKQTHSIENIQQQMRNIHQLLQSCTTKNIFTKNAASNLMQSINHTYNTILNQKVYNN